MKKVLFVLLAVFTLVLGSSVPGDAFQGGGHSGGGHMGGGHMGGSHFGGGHVGGGHFDGGHFRGHEHGHFGVDVVIGPDFGPWWWDPYPYYYPYPSTPTVVESAPEVYLDSQSPEQHYWYYCSDPSGYYPYVNRCPKGWLKVVPAPTPSGPEE